MQGKHASITAMREDTEIDLSLLHAELCPCETDSSRLLESRPTTRYTQGTVYSSDDGSRQPRSSDVKLWCTFCDSYFTI